MTPNKKPHTQYTRGSLWWPLFHGMSSIKGKKARNLGLIVILTLGITLIPSIMTWTSTGIKVSVDEFIDDTVYQLGIRSNDPNSALGYYRFLEAEEALINNPKAERVDRLVSSVGLVNGHLDPNVTYSFNQDLFYLTGNKDARVIFVSSETISRWEPLFTYEGKMDIAIDETIVSERFIDYYELATGDVLTIGNIISVDLLHGLTGTLPNFESNNRTTISDLKIVGIYRPQFITGVIGAAFYSYGRALVDLFDTFRYATLDLADSMIVHEDAVSNELIAEVTEQSYFPTTTLVQTKSSALLDDGEANVAETILSLIDILSEYSIIESWGVTQAETLHQVVTTYIQSRILIVLGFPAIFIAMLLTLSTSESSVLSRKSEMALLRTKGASYNQVFASYMYESVILCGVSLALGFSLSIILSAVIGSANGLFVLDILKFNLFLSQTVINPLGVLLGSVLALCLPMSYMFHVARNIQVRDIEYTKETDDTSLVDEMSSRTGGTIFVIIIAILLVMPSVLPRSGFYPVLQILISTISLYIAATIGAGLMRRFVGIISGKASFLIGEKSLYISSSLLRRKGRFTSLLIVLTLILSTTITMVIQVQSFRADLDNEITYAIGADLRIEASNAPISLNDSLHFIPGVIDTTPVLKIGAQIGEERFYLEGINALTYSRVGRFSSDSFLTNSSDIVLSDLHAHKQGIVLSRYYSELWNKTIGQNLTISIVEPFLTVVNFEIVGLMLSAPGFGAASPNDIPSGSGSDLGFQVELGGFALVNLDFLIELTLSEEADLILGSVLADADIASIVTLIESTFQVDVYTAIDFRPEDVSKEAYLFLVGYEGMITVLLSLLLVMGAFAIIALLGSSIEERSVEYAIMKALGATDRQVLSMVVAEFVVAVVASMGISLILGISIGSTMSMLTFSISPFSPVLMHLPLILSTTLIIVVVFQLVLLLIGCVIPAKKAAETEPAIKLRNL